MKTSEVLKKIHECPIKKHTKIDDHYQIARVIKNAAVSKKEYIHESFQEEAEGEDPMTAPPQLIKPIF